MSLVQLNDLSIAYSGPPLFDKVECRIEAKQRVGLLGRNGAGKSTLMRLIVGDEQPDSGKVIIDPNTNITLLPQGVPADLEGKIGAIIEQGHADADLPEWEAQQAVEQIASRMKLDVSSEFQTQSSGMKRRVLLGRALVSKPDLLLLDEPTNHLDIESIQWLEGFLSAWPGALLFVTHDRTFLRSLGTRILEIDRGRLFDWSCDYDTFLARKEAVLAAEEKQNALFDKRLQQEEKWIRQGIKARRTRNEGRVRALKKMRTERQDRRKQVGQARIQIQEGQRSGNLIAEVDAISFSYPEQKIVEQFSTSIFRGDKIGVIGPNGVGKTTMLRLILGTLQPEAGSVRLGTNLQVAYFDQLRDQLNENQSVVDNVGQGSSSVTINGRERHVLGYLQDFLFAPERARTEVRFLSGGERNRILLAKLFAKPANVIVLDEPTNDLDTETLELLESRLVDFGGTVLVVSHDRSFLNNVVTSTIVFEQGGVHEYDGGYDDWLRQRSETTGGTSRNQSNKKSKEKSRESDATKKKPLSFKEKQELKQLPGTIESLEEEIAAIHQRMAEPDYYKQPADVLSTGKARLLECEATLESAFSRWDELELRAND